MSSYKEFLEEARILSSTTAPSNEDIPIPITVPHSRPRGTWGQWMKEFTLPPDVLDSIVRRYDSKSWSATGGRSSARVPGEGSRVSSTSAALSWSSVAGSRDGATKEGGATTTARTMRGVSTSGARRRPMTSGRARALLRHSETPQKEARRPGEIWRFPSSNDPLSPESSQHPVKSQRSRPDSLPPPTPGYPPPDPAWSPVGGSHRLGRPVELNAGTGVNGRGSVWGQRSLKNSENGRESGRALFSEQTAPDVEVEEEEVSDWSSCSLSVSGSQEEQEEVLGVFFCKRERVRETGEGADLITWEDDEDERGKPVPEVANDTDKPAECGGVGALPLTTPPPVSDTGGETMASWMGTHRERSSEGGPEEGEDEREEREVVRMKCGCTLDQLESHLGWGLECRCSRVCGGRADPKLPPWADGDHTLVLSNIPTTISEEELEEDIQAFGEVTNCSILTLPNEAGLHIAFVRMKERESCQWVISCYQGIPYGNGGSKAMVCYMLQQQDCSPGLWEDT